MGCRDLIIGRRSSLTIPNCAAENQIALEKEPKKSNSFRKRTHTKNLEMHSTSRPQISVDVSVDPFLANVPFS